MMAEREAGPSGPISIDRTSPVPLYFQLAQYFESAIRSGALKVGARLENEVALAQMLGLSRPTVRAAFLYLANKGLVVRKRGAGTLVANERIDRNVELTSLHDDLAASGRRPATRVLRAEVSHASDQVAGALALPERALVMSLERIRLADGEPVALMHNYLPAGLVQLSVEMLTEHGLYELLRASGIGLYSATQRMGAKNASAAEARMLEETRGTALLTMERTAYDQAGRPVEFARHLYRASRYAFTTSFPHPASLLDAEFVAFRVGHDDMFGPWFLDLHQDRGAEFTQPGDLAVAVIPAGVQIEVQPVLGRLGLGHLLEQQSPAQSDPGALLNRIAGMPYGLERPECGSAGHGHHHVAWDSASAQ